MASRWPTRWRHPSLVTLLSAVQLMEIEADRFALQCVRSALRGAIISSVMLAFGPYARIETFSGARDAGHPSTVNRLINLAASVQFPDEPELSAAKDHIIEAEIRRFHRLADQRTTDGDVRSRIQKNMPLELAYDVMDRIARWVRAGPGQLDFA